MSPGSASYSAALEKVCTDTIGPEAANVDQQGAFPERGLKALAAAGLMGAVSAPEAGGLGIGFRGAAAIVGRIAQECGSTAMVTCMHYCGTAVLEAFGPMDVRKVAASGVHLSTLAFSESGSRSHFWAPLGTAERADGHVALNARKSFVTSASKATAYVWSSQPVQSGSGLSTLWLVPARSAGLRVEGTFDGLGLRGNDSSPVTAEGVRVSDSSLLGGDGKGFDIMMGTVLPLFNVLSASCSVGLMSRPSAHHSTRT